MHTLTGLFRVCYDADFVGMFVGMGCKKSDYPESPNGPFRVPYGASSDHGKQVSRTWKHIQDYR